MSDEGTPLRVAVTGATGRMGREVLAAARERGVEVVVAVNRDPDVEAIGDVRIEPAAALSDLLSAREPDALVDFTGPESSIRYVERCAEVGVPAVVGTTGFDDDDERALRTAAERVAVLRAANFSRGVQALARAIRAAVRAVPGYDAELTETHHDAKRDAPSGTAKELLDVVDEARASGGERDADERDGGQRVHGRVGDAPRSEGEIGVHARRAGDVTGEHELLLADNHEVLTLTHRAGSRGVFAAGALDAAAWIAGRNPGYYSFDDVLGGGDE